MSVPKNTDVFLTSLQISEYVRKGFSEIQSSPDIEKLVHFHSINKFLLMAHSPHGTRILGNIVANHERLALDTVFVKYGLQLGQVLKSEPSTKFHANVLQKIFGYFKKELMPEEKAKILDVIFEYRKGTTTLNDALLLLEELTRKFQKTYLVRQTYFLLYAKETESK